MSWQHLDPGAYFYGGFFYEVCVLVRSILRVLWPGIGDTGLVLAYRSVSALFGTATVAVLYRCSAGWPRRAGAPAGRRLPRGHAAPRLGQSLRGHRRHADLLDDGQRRRRGGAPTSARLGPVRRRLGAGRVGHRHQVQRGVRHRRDRAGGAPGPLGAARPRRAGLRLGRPGRGDGGAGALRRLAPRVPQGAGDRGPSSTRWTRVHDLDYGFNLWAHGWQYKPYVYQFGAAFPFSFGVALYAALLGGLIYCAVRWRRVLLVPFGYAAFYLGVMGSWDFVPIRYYLPFDPVLLIAPALALAAGLTAPAVRVRRWTGAGLALVLGYTVAFTVSTTARFTDDTRLKAQRWLQSRVRRDTTS